MRKGRCDKRVIMVEGVGEQAPFYFFVQCCCNYQSHVRGMKSGMQTLKYTSHLYEWCDITKFSPNTKMENKN